MVPFASLSPPCPPVGIRPQCRFAPWCALLIGVALSAACVVHAEEASATTNDMDPEQWQTVERLLQYDAVVGKPLAPEIGFCIDRQFFGSKRPSSRSAAGAGISPRFEAQVSQAAEACISSAAQEARKSRLVGEIVASLLTARQRRIAQETERARSCLTSSSDVQTLKGCITKARGQELPESDWQRWVTQYEQSRKP